MEIRLGNLTFRKLAEMHQFTLTEEELATLDTLRQDNASVEKGTDKCHIFDIPRVIVCGNEDTAHKVVDVLMKHASEIKGEVEKRKAANEHFHLDEKINEDVHILYFIGKLTK